MDGILQSWCGLIDCHDTARSGEGRDDELVIEALTEGEAGGWRRGGGEKRE